MWMQLTEDVYSALKKYFSTISNIGYKSYGEVDKLLVFIFIEEILNGPMCAYVSEEDYKTLTDTLECMYGTCMIPYPSYKKGIDEPYNSNSQNFRGSELDYLRVIDNLIRVV